MQNMYFIYYQKIIKPYEKKYNFYCTLYQLFPWKYFLYKLVKYQNLINNFYKTILNNSNALKELETNFKKFI